ncbi:DUF58 domain-containing protein [Inhella gelatinilytica]|uniref:DUF58 domain-containing protein n=1 Tax=Inhella gelatinilytica TaxID=2795030 RepID=UPI002872B06D|nr:DUF58 domain-containing protein [Inhella gelatinilytica]
MNPLRTRWRAWLSARHPAQDDWRLSQRHLYIVPTRIGVAFLLTQAVLLVASINDQLSLGYALTFLLCGAGLASMLTTHGNLSDLHWSLQPLEGGHADADLPVVLRVHNPGRARFGVGIRWAEAVNAPWAWVDVPAQSHAEVHLSWRAANRGRHPLPRLRIETRFPLGLFVAWSYWQPASRQWVYPAVETPCPPLPTDLTGTESSPARGHGHTQDEELHQLRAWQTGDRLRDVLWKREAQSSDPEGPLWVAERRAAQASRLHWLDAAHTQGLDPERRWQRLAAWVVAVDATGQDWGLRLGSDELPPAQGSEQRRQALERLALA